MSAVRIYRRSFAGGEVAPYLAGRVDDTGFQTGLLTCRNAQTLPHGPVRNRSGTRFVRRAKYPDRAAVLRRFLYNEDQTFALELGDGYIRFHTQGGTLLAGSPAAYDSGTAYTPGDPVTQDSVVYVCVAATTGHAPPDATRWHPLSGPEYEIPAPYSASEVRDIHWVQSSDVLTLVHPSHAPRELRRYGATKWELAAVSFVSVLVPPSGVTATATVASGSGLASMSYLVTSVSADGREESLPSAADDCSNNLLTTGNYNTITWSAASGAGRYNVYKQSNGLYGYIGQTDGLTFRDDNITADVSKTPPIAQDPFAGTDNYPGAVSYFEQRRVFAGTNAKPLNLWMTRSGSESNMAYSIPTRDDDALGIRVAALDASPIRHIVPLSALVLLTGAGEWRVTSVNSDAITPTSISVKPQSWVGASNVQPEIVNSWAVYEAARGGHPRELAYSLDSGGFATQDIGLRATHLFDNRTLRDLAFAKAPWPMLWAVSSSGELLSATYIPEQNVRAWHRHDTATKAGASAFESVCVVPEGLEDAVYVLTRRIINGAEVRFVERFASRDPASAEDMFFVDCGATWDGPETSVIGGLDWLEGETVSILADGAVLPQATVSGGQVSLQSLSRKVHVGLPVTTDMELPTPILEGAEAFGQGRAVNVNRVWLKLLESSGVRAGPDADHLTLYKQRTDESFGTPTRPVTGEVELRLSPSWNNAGRILIRQSDPLPLAVLALTAEVSYGS